MAEQQPAREEEFVPPYEISSHTKGVSRGEEAPRKRGREPGRMLVALYPSPAGPTESLLDVAAWEEVELENQVLREMRPCVEALLVNRLGAAREYFIAPIDECFKLVGLVRANWRGLSGGAEMWRLIEQFFAGLKTRAGARGGEPNA